jgi:hypothetical protein
MAHGSLRRRRSRRWARSCRLPRSIASHHRPVSRLRLAPWTQREPDQRAPSHGPLSTARSPNLERWYLVPSSTLGETRCHSEEQRRVSTPLKSAECRGAHLASPRGRRVMTAVAAPLHPRRRGAANPARKTCGTRLFVWVIPILPRSTAALARAAGEPVPSWARLVRVNRHVKRPCRACDVSPAQRLDRRTRVRPMFHASNTCAAAPAPCSAPAHSLAKVEQPSAAATLRSGPAHTRRRSVLAEARRAR